VVNSRLRFARNIILVENKRLRSSQPRQAAKRYPTYKNRNPETNFSIFEKLMIATKY
tara:strand:+ start:1293 stop:1463 length:171 start_codon:yes stop_codon:yes gene_type:complete